ncbi:Sigma 54 interacting domain protein [Thermodesulfatator indicus DSM 15286]|uniref:DNA repair protein RecN n=1 Tax=Thermodesulfatator indicus (strain DSM 15286 / JCM 11887 / CIR29812) TaxID=667014 RepID=F8AAF6_THEID|nr:DNA repair protein RecN [Thermodesulfatator indicus]AEH45376.1 Sigma 54 interacting domain protein [Thermodesulfatator indicus DSM 15286]
MLLELRLKNFVLIEEARLSFEPGFVVFTGETGTGKSLLIKSLKLALGARSSPGLIRPGAKEAILEAVVSADERTKRHLEKFGLEPTHELIIRRVITPDRSRAYLNGSPVTLQMLSEILSDLVVIAGQHEYQTLNKPEERLLTIDTFGELFSLRKAYEEAYLDFRQKLEKLQSLQEKVKNALKEEDFLKFQLQEIEAVSPEPGEDIEIEEKLKRLKNLARLKDLASNANAGVEKSFSLVSAAKKSLGQALEFDKKLAPLAERLETLSYELEDVSLELSDYLRSLEIAPDELEALEERLFAIKRLKRKYGPTLEDVLSHYEKIKKDLEDISTGEEHLQELEEEAKLAEKKALELAEELSNRRKQTAELLSQNVNRLLKELALEGARFRISFTRKDLSPTGFDQVEFLVTTHPKAPWRPMAEVASGGELSRFFLAIKAALSKRASAQALIFDEIDAGVGGMVAHRLGKLLAELATNYQVICVTHLPQIAALASQHFVVEKEITSDEALTSIRPLSNEERVEEIARMLGDPTARDVAKKLLGL